MRGNSSPFFHRGPVLDPAYFFGRSEEIAAVLRCAAGMESCFLVGGVKRGKSSVLLHLQRDETLRRHGVEPGSFLRPYLSLEGLAGARPEALFHSLLRETIRCPGSPPVRRAEERLSPMGELGLAELESGFDELDAAGAKVLFLVDEFETVRANPDLRRSFLSALQRLGSRPNCAFVIASETPPEAFVPSAEEEGAALCDLCTTIRLGRFAGIAVREMVNALSDRAGRLWDVAPDRIVDWTGGEPYLVQLACSVLWQRSGEGARALTDADYAHASAEFVNQSEAFCHCGWRRLSEAQKQAMLNVLGGTPGSGEEEQAARELLEADVLVERNSALTVPSRAMRVFAEARLREREQDSLDYLFAARLANNGATETRPAADKRTVYEITRALAAAAEGRDHLTRGHSEGTARLAAAIAERMGLSPEEVDGLRIAGELHDIGKIGVSEHVLLKSDKLTDRERDLVRTHVLVSTHILEALHFPWEVKPAVRFHHERVDGSGYPNGLVGDEIPLSARVLAVADVFTAMTAPRSHRPAHAREDAIAEITRSAGTKYDPQVVAAFVHVAEAGGV